MDGFLNSVGLTPEFGPVILLLALSCGIVFAGGAVVISNSLPFDFNTVEDSVTSSLALAIGVGLIGLLYILTMLFTASPSAAPVIVSAGLGLLAGPLFVQFLARCRMPFFMRLLTVVAFQCLIVSVAVNALPPGN